MTSTLQSEYCQCFTFKRCDKFKLKCASHGGMYTCEQVPKLELKYWKLRARELTLHLINVAQINAT